MFTSTSTSTPTSRDLAQPKLEYQLVNSTPLNPNVLKDLAVRALIRKQAMKKVTAARRRDGGYGKHNLRQYPVFVTDGKMECEASELKVIGNGLNGGGNFGVGSGDTNANEVMKGERLERGDKYTANTHRRLEHHSFIPIIGLGTSKDSTVNTRNKFRAPNSITEGKSQEKKRSNTLIGREKQHWNIKTLPFDPVIPSSIFSPTSYELMLSKFGFDILELSTLATLHVGRATRRALCKSPESIVHQIRTQKQWSFLSFLPNRYGHSPCLSAAVDCVVARARQIISCPHNTKFWEPLVLSHYITALETLQRALDSPTTRYKPEVLCATEILALYELLQPSGEAAWIRHSAGAARLILLRRPESYTTDFERALFMGHTGPIMTEALLNGERCFLEQSAWQNLLMSVICNEEYYTVSDRSEIVVLLIMAKSNIPGTFWDMTQLLCREEEPSLEYVVQIQKWCRELRQRFMNWKCKYEALIGEAGDVGEGTMEFDRRAKAYATFLSCVMFSNRLLGCVSPKERIKLERETQKMAKEMLVLDERVRGASKAADLFMQQTAGVAMATQASRRNFEEGVGRTDPGGLRHGFVEKEVFEKWCVSFGRKIVVV
ncbi:2d48933b-c2e2-4077-9e8d-7469ac408db9 [Sclerotinia trifoliorum]|uniref:2d48933b-c2e2-4077-9e8d-7469ac408db9 n=1 Tax=Sclerotinia trifoliorum TaxID=28548 RepID=A0A8H2VNC4_9HELO|nr:2d48933b-c2e2-4077-9e8d-7469ac408db9 [Sclerotinia trifoliorum]